MLEFVPVEAHVSNTYSRSLPCTVGHLSLIGLSRRYTVACDKQFRRSLRKIIENSDQSQQDRYIILSVHQEHQQQPRNSILTRTLVSYGYLERQFFQPFRVPGYFKFLSFLSSKYCFPPHSTLIQSQIHPQISPIKRFTLKWKAAAASPAPAPSPSAPSSSSPARSYGAGCESARARTLSPSPSPFLSLSAPPSSG